MGSPQARTIDTGSFRVTQAMFVAHDVLTPHTHDRHIFAVMLGGGFETRIAGHRLECQAGVAWTEPCEETHANFVGRAGAYVVVTQPSAEWSAESPRVNALLSTIVRSADPLIALDARRIVAELANSDDYSALVLDSLVTLMIGRAARLNCLSSTSYPPDWVRRAREFVHGNFRLGFSLRQAATEVGVSPWHLAREFRRHFDASMGEYARSLRINWALEQLSSTDRSVSEIAGAAGYADQSHLIRACKHHRRSRTAGENVPGPRPRVRSRQMRMKAPRSLAEAGPSHLHGRPARLQ